jgi:hypothetical protein
MITNLSPLSAVADRVQGRAAPLNDGEESADLGAKVIRFPGLEAGGYDHDFHPVTQRTAVESSFQPKDWPEGRLKRRFKLAVYRPERYPKRSDEMCDNIIDAGFGSLPVDFYPEAV